MSNIVNCCIFKCNGKLSVVYEENGKGVVLRHYEGRRWGNTEVIAEKPVGSLSVNISYGRVIFVFCQNDEGNIMLYNNKSNEWRGSVILKNTTNTLYDLCIHTISNENTMYLLYNTPSDITGSLVKYKIVMQELSSGKWGEHYYIDTALDTDSAFAVQSIATNHYAVYYTRPEEDGESIFGYKEYYLPDTWSDFKPLFKTPYTISDKSIITTNNGVHAALIVKGKRAAQLIYINKLGDNASAPYTLFESETLENAVIFMHLGNIYIIFSAGSYGYFSTVLTKGAIAFSRPSRIRPASDEIIKAKYLSDTTEGSGVYIGDLLTDAKNPGAALFLEEIYNNFYPVGTKEEASALDTALSGARSHQDERFGEQEEISELKELLAEKTCKISSLEKMLSEAYQTISDDERRITELNSVLSGQNEQDISAAYGQMKAESSDKSETISRLQNRIIELQAENASLAAAVEAQKNSRKDAVEANISPEKIPNSDIIFSNESPDEPDGSEGATPITESENM